MIKKRFSQSMLYAGVVCLGLAAFSPPLMADDWNFVRTLNPALYLVAGKVQPGAAPALRLPLPRSSLYAHDFLRATLSMYTIDHGAEVPGVSGYLFHQHSSALPYVSGGLPQNDDVTPPPTDPETRVSHWSVY